MHLLLAPARRLGRFVAMHSRALAFGLLALACLFLLTLAVAAMPLALPTNDEYCFAAFASLGGSPVEAANAVYRNWGGRWLGMLTLAAVNVWPWQPGLTLIGLPIWFAGFFFAGASVVPGTRARLAIAALALAVFWAACPSTADAFGWLGGIIMYGVPFALGALAIFLLTRGSLWAVVPAAMSVLFNELAGIALVAGLLPFAKRRDVGIVLLATLAAFMIVAFSPGNAVRESLRDVVPFPRLAFLAIRPYDTPWPLLFDFRLWALALLLAAFPKPAADTGQAARIAGAVLLAVAVTTAAIVFGGWMIPQPYLLNFLFAIIVGGAVASSRLVRLPVRPEIAALALALGLITGPNVGATARGLSEGYANREHTLDRALADLSAKRAKCLRIYFGVGR